MAHARVGSLPDYVALAALGSNELDDARAPADLAPFLGCVTVSGRIVDIYLASGARNSAAAALDATHASDVWLGMSREAVGDVLTRVAQSLPEIESLFERSVLSASQTAGITEQAREVLIVRNLQLLQGATEARHKEEEFLRVNRRLEEAVRRDALTGVFNRRHFDATLATEFARASEHGWPLSLAFLDLDHFKSINDRYGHQAGDAVLVAIAEDLERQLRQDDLLARYGGEEFVLLLPGSGLELALKVIERVRCAVEALAPWREWPGLRVTVSGGVAVHMDGARRMDSPEDLVRAADEALYRAKRQGRNRVESAS